MKGVQEKPEFLKVNCFVRCRSSTTIAEFCWPPPTSFTLSGNGGDVSEHHCDFLQLAQAMLAAHCQCDPERQASYRHDWSGQGGWVT